MQPDVSVIIAAWNAEATLRKTLESALAQRDVSVEVVVVDDASSDATVDVVRQVADARVKLVRLDRNSGPAGARNAGFGAARGRWLAVLDADDSMSEDRLSRLIDLAAARHAQIAVDNLEISGPGDVRHLMFDRKRLEMLGDLALADFVDGNLMFSRSFSLGYMKPVFERRFVERHGLRYDPALRIGEDYLLLAEALALGARCVVDPEPGYRYAVRTGSISRVLEIAHVEALLGAELRFQSGHEFSATERAALARRGRSLRDARAFLEIVEHIKQRAPAKALSVACRTPRAIRHLRMPVAARLRRVGHWIASYAHTTQNSKSGASPIRS